MNLSVDVPSERACVRVATSTVWLAEGVCRARWMDAVEILFLTTANFGISLSSLHPCRRARATGRDPADVPGERAYIYRDR